MLNPGCEGLRNPRWGSSLPHIASLPYSLNRNSALLTIKMIDMIRNHIEISFITQISGQTLIGLFICFCFFNFSYLPWPHAPADNKLRTAMRITLISCWLKSSMSAILKWKYHKWFSHITRLILRGVKASSQDNLGFTVPEDLQQPQCVVKDFSCDSMVTKHVHLKSTWLASLLFPPRKLQEL